ncbi:MAG: hypothetical protein QME66_09620 [Candidatus Eisenbacteria bacterium]|nr:hypothetical protein [Candidatus Eisenbacteria bacterium]
MPDELFVIHPFFLRPFRQPVVLTPHATLSGDLAHGVQEKQKETGKKVDWLTLSWSLRIAVRASELKKNLVQMLAKVSTA